MRRGVTLSPGPGRCQQAAAAQGCCSKWGIFSYGLNGPFRNSLDGLALSKRTTSIGAKPLWHSKTLFLIAFFRCHPVGGASLGPPTTPQECSLSKSLESLKVFMKRSTKWSVSQFIIGLATVETDSFSPSNPAPKGAGRVSPAL